MNCEQCLKKDKKIRVIQSDYDFELRKTIEDKAEEKALYEISMQKEIRKCQDKYHKQKLDHEEDNKKWLNKIDEQALKCEKEVEEEKKECQKKMDQYRQEVDEKYQIEREGVVQKYEKVISDMKNCHSKEKESIINGYKRELASTEEKFTSQIKLLTKEAQEQQETMKKELDSIILGLRSQKNAEEKLNKKLQQDHKKDRTRYLGDIYDLKATISKLEQNIKELNSNIKDKNQQISNKNMEIVELKKQHAQQMKQSRQQHERIKKQWQTDVQNHVKAFYEREIQITAKYEEAVNYIEEKRENERILYKSNIEQIRCCIESRQSKVEDLEQILVLKDRLTKKERDYEQLQRDARHIQLELQNKEDTYNKLFIPSVNSAHLNDCNSVKRKELKLKRANKHVSSTVRDILHAVNVNSSNLPLLHNIEKKYLPPKSNKIL